MKTVSDGFLGRKRMHGAPLTAVRFSISRIIRTINAVWFAARGTGILTCMLICLERLTDIGCKFVGNNTTRPRCAHERSSRNSSLNDDQIYFLDTSLLIEKDELRWSLAATPYHLGISCLNHKQKRFQEGPRTSSNSPRCSGFGLRCYMGIE